MQGAGDGQLGVNDVFLWYVAQRLSEAVEVTVEVLAVGEYPAARCPAPAVEKIHERALARARRAEQCHEFTGIDDEVDVVEKLARLATGRKDDFLQAAGFQSQTAAVVERMQQSM